ncbi:MAG: DUF4340 domain-containing protein [Bdellovibrionota bacterium]
MRVGRIYFTFYIFILLLSSCTLKEDKRQTAPGKPFSFDVPDVSELTIAKNDPKSGDSWTVRLQNTGGPDPTWQIASGPHGILDNLANTGYVNHLLDTLRTLRADLHTETTNGPIESFGLLPPVFYLEWRTNKADKAEQWRLKLGLPEGGKPFCIASAHAMADSAVLTCTGAAIKMLDILDSFTAVRHRALSTITSDDVEEIEIFYGNKKSVFFAQREGLDWTNRKHRRLKANIDAFLDGVTHTRIKEFVDDPDETLRLLDTLKKSRHQTIRLSGLKGMSVTIKSSKQSHELLATISNRPGAVFKLYPEAGRFLTRLPAQAPLPRQ